MNLTVPPIYSRPGTVNKTGSSDRKSGCIMRVGIANPFAHRPHVAHMVFLCRQFERLGYQIFFLGCRGRLENCVSKVNKTGMARDVECIKCRLGGIKSYLNVKLSDIDAAVPVDASVLEFGRELSYSTVCTALQIEHSSESSSEDFKLKQNGLSRSAAKVYLNARRWIRENELETVFIFSGRFDLTRAILEACKAESARFVSVERSWFGDGLQLLPGENALGLRNFHEMCRRWASRPLKYEQAVKASRLIVRRLTRSSVGEWKQYNVDNNALYKTETREIKYLFLPSSQHEWMGHQDRASGWHHPTEGMEYLFHELGIKTSDLVVRGHPGWAMKIKQYGQNRANQFYKEWAKRAGASYIDASDNIDTHSLIRAAQIVFLNGSSASMEAAWRGKPVVSLVPAAFTSSGISRNLFSRSDVDRLSGSDISLFTNPGLYSIDSKVQCQLALRYIYCANFRLMHFVNSMKAASAYAFKTVEPADLTGLASLAVEGILREDDQDFNENDTDERRVAEGILSGRTDFIDVESNENSSVTYAPMKRRFGYRWIDIFS